MWALVNLYEDGLKICHTNNILQFDVNKYKRRKLYKVKFCGNWIDGQILNISDDKWDCALINADVIPDGVRVSESIQTKPSSFLENDNNENHLQPAKSDFLVNNCNISSLEQNINIPHNIIKIDETFWMNKYFDTKNEMENEIIDLKEKLSILQKNNDSLMLECQKIDINNQDKENNNGNIINSENEHSYMGTTFLAHILKGKSHKELCGFDNNEKICLGLDVYIKKIDFYKVAKIKTPSVFLGNLALLVIGREDMITKSITGKISAKSKEQKDKIDQNKLDVLYDCFKQYLMAGKHDLIPNLRNFKKYITRKMFTEKRCINKESKMEMEKMEVLKQLNNSNM